MSSPTNNNLDQSKELLQKVADKKEKIDTREEWRLVQTALKELDVYRGAIDGKASSTRSSVANYQRQSSLVDDSIVGFRTATALLGDLNIPQSNGARSTTPGNAPGDNRTATTQETAPSASNSPGVAAESRSPVLSHNYDSLAKYTPRAGTSSKEAARQTASKLSRNIPDLLESGYLQTTPEHQALLGQKALLGERKAELNEEKQALRKQAEELQAKQRKARKQADARYLSTLVKGKNKEIAGIDKELGKLNKSEAKLDRELASEQKGLQRQLEQKVEQALPSKLKAGRSIDLLKATGLDGHVERKLLPQAGKGQSLKSLRGNPLADMAVKIAVEHNVPPDLFLGLIYAESSFNPYALSPKGAEGLGQLMPDTQARYGVTDPYDPRQNLTAAAKYLRFTHDKLDNNDRDWTLGIAAYNAGEGAVQRYGGIPPYTETINYVDRVRGLTATVESLGGAEAFTINRPAKAPSRNKHQQRRGS